MSRKHWKSIKLGSFVSLQRGYDLPESKRRPGNIPVIGSFGITGYHDTAKVKGPGVTLGRSGASIGVVTYSSVDFWAHNATLFVTNFHGNDKKFTYYFLKTIDFKSYNSGSAQPSLNRNFIYQIDIKAPPLPTQKKIASILSAYDDLIENNTKRIKILEEMAQTLYHEWFVKFRFPGHEQTKMVDSELGLIPQGWEAKQLGNIAQEIRKSVQPDAIDPETPYFGLEHLPRKSIALAEWGTAGQVQSTKLIFKKGEILFGKIRPYFHKVGVAPVNGICSSDTIVIQAKDSKYFSISLCCISSEEFVNHATQTSQATKMPRANWDVLIKYPIVIPPSPLLEQFNEFIQNIVNQIHNLILKNRNVCKTRDLLLPKLISGEIDVEHLDINTTEDVAA